MKVHIFLKVCKLEAHTKQQIYLPNIMVYYFGYQNKYACFCVYLETHLLERKRKYRTTHNSLHGINEI